MSDFKFPAPRKRLSISRACQCGRHFGRMRPRFSMFLVIWEGIRQNGGFPNDKGNPSDQFKYGCMSLCASLWRYGPSKVGMLKVALW